MDLKLWLTVGFMLIGFVVLASMKKEMDRKVAFLMENSENHEITNKPVIAWIICCAVWGVICMSLVVWIFSWYK